MALKERFGDRAALIDALKAQKIVQGDEAVANALADAGTLIEYAPGQDLISQGASDRDVFFLLAGRTRVIVNGSTLAYREKNITVGEISAINPELVRTATVQADETTVALRVGHAQLEAAGNTAPRLWKLLAADLGARLEQRNRYVSTANAKAKIFIISSSEALPIAEQIRVGLDHEPAIVDIWSDEQIFPPGAYAIEALSSAVNQADFGIAIAQPDDLLRSRQRDGRVPRDNVIFELGFFMARLGRARTMLLVPRGPEVTLPSDFKGLTPIQYKEAGDGQSLASALGAAITMIKTAIKSQGVRTALDRQLS